MTASHSKPKVTNSHTHTHTDLLDTHTHTAQGTENTVKFNNLAAHHLLCLCIAPHMFRYESHDTHTYTPVLCFGMHTDTKVMKAPPHLFYVLACTHTHM